MQTGTDLILKDLVLIGGGHSHVEVLKNFAMSPMPGVRITLLARDLHTPYSGMLPGLVAGLYSFDEAHVDLRPLCNLAGARLIHGEAIGLDLANQQVLCGNRPHIDYDLLSINIGSRQATQAVPGASDFSTPVKPINRFMASWLALIERILSTPGIFRIGVVGAGAAGVELILSMQQRLQSLLKNENRDPREIEFYLVSKSQRVLASFHAGVSQRFDRILEARGITVFRGTEAVQVGSDRIRLSDGNELELDEILWVTEGGSQSWLAAAGLAVDQHGFIELDETLQSVSHENVFAAGDIGHIASHPRPKAGVIAVRQGPPLAENLRRALLGKKLKPFKPQKNMLALIGTGDNYAIAARGNWHTEGKWVWRWKDWIDRRWMARYNELPEMSLPAPNKALLRIVNPTDFEAVQNNVMRCMGCGAKVSSNILARVLQDLSPIKKPEVIAGLDSPDDAALVETPVDGLLVHTVDHLSAIINDPYVFGKIAANHALSDIFAMGAEPQTALAIVTIPHASEKKVESMLSELMAGAIEVLNAANTALIGGHTAEGPELSLGFALNGHVQQQRVMSKRGIQRDDVLILTKPLGVGALFAADMRSKAQGRWIDGAIYSMLQSNKQAAEIFQMQSVNSCTDVTGFGLLGHLLEMCRGESLGVDIELSALPLLAGVRTVFEQGIFSSLHVPNERNFVEHVGGDLSVTHANYPLLFDPQTSGGLLASIPNSRADDCLAALHRAGYLAATKIGEVRNKLAAEPWVTIR